MGVIYLDDLGRVKQAIDLFKKSIECNPNYALAHFNLARAISITGDKVEAAKLYQVAQDINKITNEISSQAPEPLLVGSVSVLDILVFATVSLLSV